uniref:STAS domain-containing protein n=1 Tax=Chenopodium quinoa TaxID=63459 RepID=A0A803MKF2_CHEQI
MSRIGDENIVTSAASSRRRPESLPQLHSVGRPEKQTIWQDLGHTFKETFFPDDPLKSFKDQPASKKFVLGLRAVFPIFDWGRQYNLAKFKHDVIAGITIASLCIPQDIAYAKLAYLKPEYGLYSSFVPPLIYAFMGSSRDIAIGPVAVVSLLLGTLLSAVIDPDINPVEYTQLALTATFFCWLGFLVDFLSHAATVGFMAGAAITIGLQQLKGLLGIKKFTKDTDIISVLKSVFSQAEHGWNWQTIAIGVSFLILLLIAKYIGKKNKKLFWVPAMAPLTCVILSTLIVFVTRADKHGVQIVKHIDKGINPPSASKIFFTGPYLLKGIKIGAIAGVIALTEAVAIGRTFAAIKDYSIDGNKEMLALGSMNIVGSMTSCYVATGSFSRSAVNFMAGCQTAVSNIVMSMIVFLTLMVITPLFKFIPNAILAAIIISAVINLVDIGAVVLLWKIDKFDFIACMGAFFGVIFISVEIGILIAVCISFAKILLQVTRPRVALLGNLPGTTLYRNIQQYPAASTIPGALIVRVDSSIYFSNSNYVKDRTLRWLADEEELNKESNLPKIQYLIIDMSPVIDIDTSGIHALEDLNKSIQKREIRLHLANPGCVVMTKLHDSGFVDVVGQDNIHLTVGDAVRACNRKILEETA